MENKLVINFIDMGLDSFWREPSTAKLEGALGKEIAAKYYLMGKGLSAEDTEIHVDKIRSRLANLEDNEKNTPPTPPISPADGSSVSDTSYQVSSSR